MVFHHIRNSIIGANVLVEYLLLSNQCLW